MKNPIRLLLLVILLTKGSDCWHLQSSALYAKTKTIDKDLHSQDVASLRNEVILTYDTKKYDFEQEVRKILQNYLEKEELPPLNRLHDIPEADQFRVNKSQGRAINRVNRLQSLWNLHRARLSEYSV